MFKLYHVPVNADYSDEQPRLVLEGDRETVLTRYTQDCENGSKEFDGTAFVVLDEQGVPLFAAS